MRTTLLLTAAALLFSPVTATAADPPPVVFQTQPVGRLLDDARAAMALLGGERAVKEINDSLKRTFGDKGLDGLDLNRPLIGYVLIPTNPEESIAVTAFPVTTDQEFLALCERLNGSKPKA